MNRMTMNPGRLRAALAVLALAALTACGGGGGGGGGDGGGNGGGGNSTTYNIGGVISMAETSAVDSDTNDVNQSDYRVNDTLAEAQALVAPVLLVGTVNLPQAGPPGNNNNGQPNFGDSDDVFRVTLQAGQVVELEFAADPTVSDVDLYIGDDQGNLVGLSEGTDTRFECVTVTRDGSYYVNVRAFSNASIYSMRIGAPGTGAGCAASTTATGFVPGEVLVEPRVAASGAEGTIERAAAVMRTAGLTTADAAALRADVGPQVLRLPTDPVALDAGIQALAAVAAGVSPDKRRLSAAQLAQRARAAASPGLAGTATLQYAKRLRATGAFAYAHPNWLMQTLALTGTFPPNDRGYSYQRWHYEQINVPAAMSRIVGLNLPANQPRPIVAVIDDGVALDHPDLGPQLVGNGRTFVNGGDRASGDNIATRADNPVFHGTHVAGTVAAATFDGIGAAGTAPMAQIMPLRVFPSQGGARSDDVIQAMRYAAGLSNRSGTLPARKADVINMSLGSDRNCDAAYQQAISDVRAAGVIVVVAAGNSARNDQGNTVPLGSPSNCSGAVAVSATEARRQITFYSNTNVRPASASVGTLHLTGPGGDSGQSTTGNGAADNVYSTVATFDAAGRRQPAFGGMMGTSMASPHVAGVMALMRYVNPAITVAQVDNLIATSRLTDDLGAAGKDDRFGWGLINASKAVDAALSVSTSPPPTPPAQVVALPSTLDFGAQATEAFVELGASGTTTETVTSGPVTDAPANAISVDTSLVNATTGLGRYKFIVDRTRFTGNGSFYPRIEFGLSSGRTLVVQLVVVKAAGGGAGASTANLGPMYVLLFDPDTNEDAVTVLATLSNGRYTWSHSGWSRSKVAIFAGGDLDNDNLICQRGEACGAYPVLPPGDELFVVDLQASGSRSDLNFQVAPLSGISSTQAVGSPAQRGWRRTPAVTVPMDLRKSR